MLRVTTNFCVKSAYQAVLLHAYLRRSQASRYMYVNVLSTVFCTLNDSRDGADILVSRGTFLLSHPGEETVRKNTSNPLKVYSG
jgi:hypothetical protein